MDEFGKREMHIILSRFRNFLENGAVEGPPFLVGVNKMVMRFPFGCMESGLLLVKSVSYVTGYIFCSPAALEKEYVYCSVRTEYLNMLCQS